MDMEPTQTITQIAAGNEDFESLVAALTVAELADTFDQDGDFTVFAPTDAAFRELAVTLGTDTTGLDDAGVTVAIFNTLVEITGTEEDALATLTTILQYHAELGANTVAELQEQGVVETLAGETFTVDGNELIDNDPDVEDPEFIAELTDIAATNGKIQGIDRVLLPLDLEEAVAQPDIVDLVILTSGDTGFDTNGDDFDLLREALIATDLLPVVDDPNADFTVFAPTDGAFTALAVDLGFDGDVADEAAVFGFLADATGFVSAEEPGLLDDILLYHVLPGGRKVAELQAEGTVTTAEGGTITVDGTTLIDNDLDLQNPVLIDGATDLEASNGVVQGIDRVLLPLDLVTQSITDIAVSNPDFESLVAALTVAGLADTFAQPGDFTVFAPTDAAFRELAVTLGADTTGLDDVGVTTAIFERLIEITGTEEDALATLTTILEYHAKVGANTVVELQDQGIIETLAGETFTVDGIELIDNDPDVEDPEFIISLTDIQATNGTVQAIDRVLLPIDVEETVAQPDIVDLVILTSGDTGFDTNGDDFDLLREALIATDLLPVVDDPNADFTVFAPTDSAFTALAVDLGFGGDTSDEASVFGFLADATGFVSADEPGLLTDILLYHVLPEGLRVAQLQSEGTVTTAQGGTITVDGTTLIDNDPDLQDPSLIDGLTDLEASNGVVQAIDRVLLPIDVDDATGDTRVVLDFETDGNGEGLAAGDLVETAFSALGLTITTVDVPSRNDGPNPAMIFDSLNPTGGDDDLATETQGNVLIISEDNDSSDPDDNGRGGTFVFDFENAVDVEAVTVLDKEQGGTVRGYDEDGMLVGEVHVPRLGDGDIVTVDLGFEDVSVLEITSRGSFAIDDLVLDGLDSFDLSSPDQMADFV